MCERCRRRSKRFIVRHAITFESVQVCGGCLRLDDIRPQDLSGRLTPRQIDTILEPFRRAILSKDVEF